MLELLTNSKYATASSPDTIVDGNSWAAAVAAKVGAPPPEMSAI